MQKQSRSGRLRRGALFWKGEHIKSIVIVMLLTFHMSREVFDILMTLLWVTFASGYILQTAKNLS